MKTLDIGETTAYQSETGKHTAPIIGRSWYSGMIVGYIVDHNGLSLAIDAASRNAQSSEL